MMDPQEQLEELEAQKRRALAALRCVLSSGGDEVLLDALVDEAVRDILSEDSTSRSGALRARGLVRQALGLPTDDQRPAGRHAYVDDDQRAA